MAGALALAGVMAGIRADASVRPRPAEVARIDGAAADLDLAGPVLGGRGIAWAQRERNGSLSVRVAFPGSVRTIYRVALPPVPAPESRDSEYEARVIQTVGAMAGSSTRIAFVRSVMLARTPRCLPACRKPSLIKSLFSELWVGPTVGPFRRVAGGESGCGVPRPIDVDVSGAQVVYSQRTQGCASSGSGVDAVVLANAPGKRVLARSVSATLADVAISVPYVAWAQNTSARVGSAARFPGSIIVYSLRRRAVAYRLPARALKADDSLAFDVESSGAIGVVAEGPGGGGCAPSVVAWSSTSARRAHLLRVGAAALVVRIAGGTLVIARPGATCAGRRLTAVSLRGRTRTLAAFEPSSDRGESLEGDFDFDGRRFTYAVTRSVAGAGKPRYETSLYLGRLPRS